MDDYPYNTDYTPAPRQKAEGEPASLTFDPYANEDPYDDGLNPARGILMGVGLLIVLYTLCRAADYALNAFIGG